MNENYSTIFRSVLLYERGQKYTVVILLAVVLFVLGFIFLRHRKVLKKSDKICALAVLLVFSAAICVYWIHVTKFEKAIVTDIKQEGFVTYRGEFFHDDYQRDSFYHNVYITDSNGSKIQLRLPDYANMHNTYDKFEELPSGTFYGTIIYSENSKLVLSWSIV